MWPHGNTAANTNVQKLVCTRRNGCRKGCRKGCSKQTRDLRHPENVIRSGNRPLLELYEQSPGNVSRIITESNAGATALSIVRRPERLPERCQRVRCEPRDQIVRYKTLLDPGTQKPRHWMILTDMDHLLQSRRLRTVPHDGAHSELGSTAK